MTTVHDALAPHRWFAALDPVHQAEVVSAASTVQFGAGTRIARTGDDASRFFAIDTGRVALELDVPGGGLVVETLAHGDLIGFSWLLPPHRWQFDVVAVDDVTGFAFDAVGLRRAAEHDDTLALALTRGVAEILAERLHATRVRLLDVYGAPRGLGL